MDYSAFRWSIAGLGEALAVTESLFYSKGGDDNRVLGWDAIPRNQGGVYGEQPFSAITSYECVAERPILALIRLYTHFFAGIKIRDPAREDRRIGPIPEVIVCEDFDEEERDLSDTALVRLAPGEKFSTSYSFWVEPKDGRKGGDVKLMVPGNTYHVDLRKRRIRWMFEDEMEKGLDEEQRRAVLRKRDVLEWSPDCRATFTAAAELVMR